MNQYIRDAAGGIIGWISNQGEVAYAYDASGTCVGYSTMYGTYTASGVNIGPTGELLLLFHG